MPVGDLVWSLVVFGGLHGVARLMQQMAPTQLVPVVVRHDTQPDQAAPSLD
jgi:hypothetical protein